MLGADLGIRASKLGERLGRKKALNAFSFARERQKDDLGLIEVFMLSK